MTSNKDRAFAVRVLRAQLERLEAQAHDVKRRIDVLRPLELPTRSDLMREGRGLAREYAETQLAIADLECGRLTPTEVMLHLSDVRRRERPELAHEAGAEIVRLALTEDAPLVRQGRNRT